MPRGNVNNLKPLDTLTVEEQRRIQSNAGIASGKSRAKKKKMREAAKMLLDMPVSTSQNSMRNTLKAFGIEDKDMTYSMAICVAMLMKAGNGDVNAARFLRDTAGYDPMQELKDLQMELMKRQSEADNDLEVIDEVEKDDVVIYLPALDDIEDLEMEEESEGE